MPSWLPEGNTASPGDNEQRSLWKIVDLGGGGGGGSGNTFFDVGSPEGVVTSPPGGIYTTALGGMWSKISGAGSIGWQNLIAE